MPAAKRRQGDSLTKFYRLPAIPNNVLNDERRVGDRDFFDGLDLSYGPLKRVADAVHRADLEAAKAAVVKHFRTRKRPRITKYRTDPHASDWPGLTVTRRADLLCRNKIARPGGDILDADGGPAAHGRINWDIALSENHEIRRQGAILTLAEAWSRARSASAKRKYAQTLERWIRSHIVAQPFVLVPGFHREEFSAFGGRAYNQLAACYMIFHRAAILDSHLYRTPGALSDDFAFFFLLHFWLLAFQFTRLLGCLWRADNHHLMERGVACYYLGVQFPEFKRAAEMEAYGRATILKHFDHNMLTDNVGSEHCTNYNYRCLVRYALPESVARANGRTLLGKARARRLAEWLDYNAYVTAPDGRLVDTGDGAGSALCGIAEESGAMLQSALIKGVLQSLGEKGPVNPQFAPRWRATRPKLPAKTSRIFPHAGHLVMRDGWKRSSLFLHMAIKNESLYNIHTHWNMFEFTLAAGGKRLIGNPTARTYGMPQGLLRGFYFSMDAHNTLVIDDDNLKSHRALAQPWGLQPTRIATAGSCLNAAGRFDYATFTHRGYLPLIHRRDVLLVRGRYVLMTDGIAMDFADFNTTYTDTGDIRAHTYRQRIHFEKDVTAQSTKPLGSVAARHRRSPVGVLIVPEPFENLSTQVGPNEYLKQLHHPRFRGYRMADIVRRTIGPCFFSTVYYPFTGQPPRVVVDALTPKTTPFRDDPCHAVRIDDGRCQDIWFVQRSVRRPTRHTVAGDGVALETDAACVYLSIRNRRVVDGFRIGGRSVVCQGKRLPLRAFRLVRHVGD